MNSFDEYLKSKFPEVNKWTHTIRIRKSIIIAPILIKEALIDAFLGLLLLSLFLFLILGLSQGKDLIVTLFEPKGFYGNVRLIYITLSLVFYSFAIWIIPAQLFKLQDIKHTGKRNYTSVFDKHLFFVHRTLALLPLWGFASCIYNNNLIVTIVFTCATIGLWLFYRFFEVSKKLFWIAITFILLLCCAYILYYYQEKYNNVKHAYSAFLIFLSYCLFIFFKGFDKKILIEEKKFKLLPQQTISHTGKRGFKQFIHIKLKSSKLWADTVLNYYLKPNSLAFSRWLYNLLFWGILVYLFLILFFFDLRDVAPESLLLFTLGFYIFFIDWFYFFFIRLFSAIRILLSFALIIVVIFFSGSPGLNYNHFRVDLNEQPKKILPANNQLLTFEDYYKEWIQRIPKATTKDSTHPFPIVLIAGEGGGSRAGLWFAQNMIMFDSISDNKLKNHVFSISTVSGSSVGAGTIMAYWQYIIEHPSEQKNQWMLYPEKIFRNNFISCGLKGWLMTDMWKTIIPNYPWTADRNTLLQEQESQAVQQAINEVREGKNNDLKLFKFMNNSDSDPHKYLSRDFLSYYYDTTREQVQFKTDFPLLFLNTCRSSDGKRGIFSPICLSNNFLDAIDITSWIYQSTIQYTNDYENKTYIIPSLHKSISLGAAINTSEIFPIFSASAYIDSLGYFIDGGYHDNSGLKTTLEIEKKLRSLLAKDSLKENIDYQIYVLYFKNGQFYRKYYPKGQQKLSLPGIQPVIAVTQLPFGGSADYFEEVAKTQMNGKFIRCDIDYKHLLDSNVNLPNIPKEVKKELLEDIRVNSKNDVDTTVNFPLARWLSYTISEGIIDASKFEYYKHKEIRKLIDKIKEN